MGKDDITDAQWRVLEHFILNESRRIEQGLQKDGKVTSNNIEHYSAYSDNVKENLNVNVSRPTVNSACKKLVNLSILKISDTAHTGLKGGKSNFYSLKSDLATIRMLVRGILKKFPYSKAKRILGNYYFTYNLNESLVREVLYEKNVSIKRPFHAIDWNPNDAQRVLDILEQNESSPGDQEPTAKFSESIKEAINEFENQNHEFENRYINRLKKFCDEFYEDLNDPLFDEKKFYFKEYDLYDLSKSKYDVISRNSISSIDYNFIDPISPLCLKLPVLDNSNEKINTIKSANLDIFYYTYYGYKYDNLKRFPNSLINDIRKIISSLERLQERILQNSTKPGPIIVANDSMPFSRLIGELQDYINQITIEQNQCNTFLSYNKLKRFVDKLHDIIVEHLTLAKEEYDSELIDNELESIKYKFETLIKILTKCSIVKGLNDEYIERNFSNLLKEHYSVFEYEKLILPILSLIHCSPNAMNEFLNGDWESFDLTFNGYHEVKNSKFLTKLIHIALVDLMCSPDIPENGIVESVSINSFSPSSVDIFDAMELKDNVRYPEYRDSVIKDYFNEISYDRLKTIEEIPFKIKLKHIYELTLYPRLSATNKNDDNTFSCSLSVDILPNVEWHLFRVNKLKDATSLISKLRETDNGIYSHIRNLLSQKMQNIILHYDLSSQPSFRLQEDILKELSMVLLKPELYSKSIPAELIDSDEKLNDLIEAISSASLSYKDLIQMVHTNSASNLSNSVLINNKRVLMKIFEDEFICDF